MLFVLIGSLSTKSRLRCNQYSNALVFVLQILKLLQTFFAKENRFRKSVSCTAGPVCFKSLFVVNSKCEPDFTRAFVYMRVCVFKLMYVSIYVCMCVHECVDVFANFMNLCVCMCMCACVCAFL